MDGHAKGVGALCVLYYNEQFYAIDVSSRVVVVNVKSDNTHVTAI
ncbi:hypothetical protein QYF36_008141 [Acer negundo]|nr:hypothetical protein QYF36_008141 [Acer negundo]